MKIYHQQRAFLGNIFQRIDFIFGDTINYYQMHTMKLIQHLLKTEINSQNSMEMLIQTSLLDC